MSATLPNLSDLSSWLLAEKYETKYRPVTLDVKICSKAGLIRQINNTTYPRMKNAFNKKEMSQTVIYDGVFASERSLTGDVKVLASVRLCGETIEKNKSVVVFCSSKVLCGDMGRKIAGYLKYALESPTDSAALSKRASLARQRALLLEELSQTQGGLCPILKITIPDGVSYHHAGLAIEERKLIESAFSRGVLKILCATSTLAAGVNLPAHRVIILSTKMGHDDLSVSSFRQMCGRAGRMGMDTSGEAILIVDEDSASDKASAVKVVMGDIPKLESKLHLGKGGGLEKLLLETICFGGESVSTKDKIYRFVQCTLLSRQMKEADVSVLVEAALDFLWSHGFLLQVNQNQNQNQNQDQDQRKDQGNSFALNVGAGKGIDAGTNAEANMNRSGLSSEADSSGQKQKHDQNQKKVLLKDQFLLSPLGRATVLSGIPPRNAVDNIDYLQSARSSFYLKGGGIHPVFLVTPPEGGSNISIKWTEYSAIFDLLVQQYEAVEEVAQALGVDRGRLQRYQHNPPSDANKKEQSKDTKFYRRFYCAIILFSLIQERPLDRVIEKMDLTRGAIRQLQLDAAIFGRVTCVFCMQLNWNLLSSCLEPFLKRLSFGVPEELLPLARLGSELMPSRRARDFVRVGIKNPMDLASADVDKITSILIREIPYESGKPLSASFVSSDRAKSLLKNKYKDGGNSSKSISTKQEMNDEDEMRLTKYSCERLARKLKKAASDSIIEENSLAALLAEHA